MPLADFLLPAENIQMMSDEEVALGEKKYRVIVTDMRLIFYSRRGLLFHADDIISKKLGSISSLQYNEKGFLFTKATISIIADNRLDLHGRPENMKVLYQLLQSAIKK
jgi:hypothetical protein